DWTAPAGQTTALDWISFFKAGDVNKNWGPWTYTNGATSGTFTVTAPSANGIYEFRYLPNDRLIDVARSNAVTVTSTSSTISLLPTPVLSCSFNEAAGASASDSSGNGNAAAL